MLYVMPTGRANALAAVANAPEGFRVKVEPPKRSGEQNDKLHAELGEIAGRVEWAGKKRDVETWKRLMTAAWLRARGESIEVLPALDGHGVDILFRRTSTMTKSEVSELIEYVCAWKAEHMESA
jgi:NinB protein